MLRLFQELVLHPQPTDLVLEFFHVRALHRSRSLIGLGMRAPPRVHPVAQRAVMDAEITGDLSDRPAGLQDHLHRLSLELRAEPSANFWHEPILVRSRGPVQDHWYTPVRRQRSPLESIFTPAGASARTIKTQTAILCCAAERPGDSGPPGRRNSTEIATPRHRDNSHEGWWLTYRASRVKGPSTDALARAAKSSAGLKPRRPDIISQRDRAVHLFTCFPLTNDEIGSRRDLYTVQDRAAYCRTWPGGL